MAVIAALKLNDVLAARECARQANRRHRGFRSRADEAHHLDRGECFPNQLAQLTLGASRSAEAGAVFRSALYRCDYLRIGMAEDHRSPGADVIDVFVSIGIPHPAALCVLNDRRFTTHSAERANRGVHPAWK